MSTTCPRDKLDKCSPVQRALLNNAVRAAELGGTLDKRILPIYTFDFPEFADKHVTWWSINMSLYRCLVLATIAPVIATA